MRSTAARVENKYADLGACAGILVGDLASIRFMHFNCSSRLKPGKSRLITAELAEELTAPGCERISRMQAGKQAAANRKWNTIEDGLYRFHFHGLPAWPVGLCVFCCVCVCLCAEMWASCVQWFGACSA